MSPDHPETFTTRSNIARFTGESGDPVTAFHLFGELDKDQTRVQGAMRRDAFRNTASRIDALLQYRDQLAAPCVSWDPTTPTPSKS